MNRISWSRLLRIVAGVVAMWAVSRIVFQFIPRQDEVAAMVLLLCVLAVATLADRILAVATSLAAGLSFSYYFIGPAYTFRITSIEDGLSFGTFIIVALTGSHLALRAQLRAEETERRRGEMERLQRLGAALLATDTVDEVAEEVVREIVTQFGGGAILRVDGLAQPFQSGVTGPRVGDAIAVETVSHKSVLELYGMKPSVEVQSALVNLIGLALDRSSAAEDRGRFESARRGDELRTTVLNALAHNFRTPLTCIKAAASMMRGSASEPGTYSQELVEVIDEEADRLNELIRDSLDLARIQSGQANPTMEDCAVASVVSAVLGKMKRYLSKRTVMVDVPDGLPVVRGDRFLLEQMLTQIIDNAWKYSAAEAKIWISACQSDDEVVLRIRNEGPQIPGEERGLVFDRFYRGVRSRAGVEGTGLGLAIAKTIAEAHSGRVWLESDPDGPVFCFSIPAGTPEGTELEEDNDREPHYITD